MEVFLCRGCLVHIPRSHSEIDILTIRPSLYISNYRHVISLVLLLIALQTMFAGIHLVVPAIVAVSVAASVTQEAYTWDNVFIGGGGGISRPYPFWVCYALLISVVEGFIPGIVFNPTQKGLAYARYVSYPMV